MIKIFIINFLLLSSVLSLRDILPFSFVKKQNFLECFSKTSFFELNCQYLKTEDLIFNQKLDNVNVNWPVLLKYNRRPKLKKYPFLLLPKVRTTEYWNFDIDKNQITAEISTSLLELDIVFDLVENSKKELVVRLSTNIKNMNSFLPIKKDIIEEELFEQIKEGLNKVLPKLNLSYLKLIN